MLIPSGAISDPVGSLTVLNKSMEGSSFLPIFRHFLWNSRQRLYCCFNPGFTKRCRLSWLTNSALVYEPKCGGYGGLRQWVYSCSHGAQINFGDLNFILNLAAADVSKVTFVCYAVVDPAVDDVSEPVSDAAFFVNLLLLTYCRLVLPEYLTYSGVFFC